MEKAVFSVDKYTGKTYYHGFQDVKDVERGICDITPNEYMKNEFEKSIEKAGSVGLHLVHIFHIEPISKALECRKAYFDGYADAELYAYQYDMDHKDNENPELGTYLIYINCELYKAHFKGRYADDFMGLQKKIEK